MGEKKRERWCQKSLFESNSVQNSILTKQKGDNKSYARCFRKDRNTRAESKKETRMIN